MEAAMGNPAVFGTGALSAANQKRLNAHFPFLRPASVCMASAMVGLDVGFIHRFRLSARPLPAPGQGTVEFPRRVGRVRTSPLKGFRWAGSHNNPRRGRFASAAVEVDRVKLRFHVFAGACSDELLDLEIDGVGQDSFDLEVRIGSQEIASVDDDSEPFRIDRFDEFVGLCRRLEKISVILTPRMTPNCSA